MYLIGIWFPGGQIQYFVLADMDFDTELHNEDNAGPPHNMGSIFDKYQQISSSCSQHSYMSFIGKMSAVAMTGGCVFIG